MIDDETRARALAQVQGQEKEYADGWKDDDASTAAQAAADAGVAAGKKADVDPDFNYDEPGAVSTPVKVAEVVAEPIEPAKAMTFKETFAARRKAGDATFEWNGKKYTTDLRKPAASTGAKAITPPSKATAAQAKSATSLTQDLGRDYAAVKSAADTMPVGTSATARSALNEDVARRQRIYEQAAAAEKSGTSVAKQPPAPVKVPMTLSIPAETDPLLNIAGKTTLAQGRDPRKGV